MPQLPVLCTLILTLSVCTASFQIGAATWSASAQDVPDACRSSNNFHKINVVGKTAFTANACRVLSERKLSRPLYYDAFGHVFLNEWTENHIKLLSQDFGEFLFEMPIRTAFYDAQVKQAMAEGIKQVVIIGSGLDCRPLRLHDPSVQFFEFDQTAMLDYKVSKLATLPIPRYPSKLIRGDYLQLDMKRELLKVGFDAGLPALFIWEGNSMYIDPQQSTTMLQNILKEFPHSKIAFDCVTDAISGAHPPTAELQWFYDLSSFIVREVGVAPTWQACDMHEMAREVPFKIVELSSLWDLSLRYRDDQGLRETFGGRAGFEATQGWMKHYMHCLATRAAPGPAT